MAIQWKRIAELLEEGLSQDDVCSALHCSKRDVSSMARFMKDTGFGGEALTEIAEDDLRRLVAPKNEASVYVAPDLDHLCRELKKPGVTRKLLWYEYCNTTASDGQEFYRYSQFCKLIEHHLDITGATMRLKHVVGRCLYVDWAGLTMSVRDRVTSRDLPVYIFVACLPYSGMTFAKGYFDLTQRSWLAAHEATFAAFGGVASIVVPDNCATATDRTPIYTTVINSTYQAFAEHHNTAIVPTRRRAPQDKAHVEGAVGNVERWVIAPLRNETFFDLDELNEVIQEKVNWINERPFAAKDSCRFDVFMNEEKKELKPSADTRFEQCAWKKVKVSPDYHVQIDYMRYSVDYRLIRQTLDAKISDTRIDLFKDGALAASHKRLFGRKGQLSTLIEHMPPNHQHYDSTWSPDSFAKWARRIGPNTERLIVGILASKPIVEQAFVPCSNILNLARKGRADLLEKASQRIAEQGAGASYTLVKNTMAALAAVKEDREVNVVKVEESSDEGSNAGRTRGADYYRREKGVSDAD